jgi:3-oxoacyl-[acyl-carrier-protein] synthase-3
VNELSNARISGIVSCVPKAKEANKDFFKGSEKDFNDFVRRVGVEERRTSKGRLTSSDLCIEASNELIADLNWNLDDIDILIFVSQTQDYNTPPTSCYIQRKLGLNKKTFLLDLNLGCTGWVAGLSTTTALMKANNYSKGLLLCGETNILTDESDPASYLLMGDAGTATAIEFDSNIDSKMVFDFENYGNHYDAIISKHSKARHVQQTLDQEEGEALSLKTVMDGQKLLVFTLRNVVPKMRDFLTELEYPLLGMDYFFFHQANKMFIDSIIKKLKLPLSKVPFSLKHFGNTSSASIPLTICCFAKNKDLSSKTIICGSFGVGLSIANLSVKLPKEFKSKLIEI